MLRRRRSSGPPPPGLGESGVRRMAVTAKWIGRCAKGQRPGDVIMPGGMTVNVLDMRKQMKGAPPPKQ